MNNFEKILYRVAIGVAASAGVISFISSNWTLGINQICLAWFIMAYYAERNK
jgi:hypothetical protein